MKIFPILFFACLLLTTGSELSAQQRVKMNVNYSVMVPTGNFREYVGKTSFRGWSANITYRINEQFAVGATTGFQDFYDKTDRALYKDLEGSDVSAVVSRSIQTIPLLATIHYKLTPAQSIQPYVGLGIGGNLILHSRYLGQFANDNNKLSVAARPEIGLFIPLRSGSESGVNIAGVFNFMPYNEGDLENISSWGINVGAKFPLR